MTMEKSNTADDSNRLCSEGDIDDDDPTEEVNRAKIVQHDLGGEEERISIEEAPPSSCPAETSGPAAEEATTNGSVLESSQAEQQQQQQDSSSDSDTMMESKRLKEESEPLTEDSPARAPEIAKDKSNSINANNTTSTSAATRVEERTAAVRNNENEGTNNNPNDDVLALPIDALHCVASFLAPSEWSTFGRTNRAASKVCGEIVRRARMHGFLCAAEVVTAWKLGHHSDAKELAALYVHAGVPIYPRSLGHSYHTILWRMGVEAREMEEEEEANNNNDNSDNDGSPESDNNNNDPSSSSRPEDSNGASDEQRRRQGQRDDAESPRPSVVDEFFTDRPEFRTREGYNADVTYLEEKSLFWLEKEILASGRRPPSSFLNLGSPSSIPEGPPAGSEMFRPPPRERTSSLGGGGGGGGGGTTISPQNKAPAAAPDGVVSPSYYPKLPLKVHQHLFDQHVLGRFSIDDEDGTMVTPPVSLSADFFHPTMAARSAIGGGGRPRSGSAGKNPQSAEQRRAAADNDLGVPGYDHRQQAVEAAMALVAGGLDNNNNAGRQGDRGAIPANEEAAVLDELAGVPGVVVNDEDQDAIVPPAPPLPAFRLASVMKYVDIETYSSSMNGALKADDSSNGCGGTPQELKRHMRSRFATYQRRLETFLAHGDSSGFEECILDFWDEFFPRTTSVHYYDRHTAVPRISCLQKFLTKPCPKSIGIVQCEIERIKITTRGKGVNVKGRLFPTYEYRLFIRNRPHGGGTAADGGNNAESDEFVRRDTILMVAKNRGRKHAEASGVVPATAASKKGSNNYYLYMPQQIDIDAHFNKVNEAEQAAKMNPNGASHDPVLMSDDAGSVLLGRLQSNFIGTEFQIFTPHIRKRSRNHHSNNGRPDSTQLLYSSPSDDDFDDYDSGVSSDNNSSRRATTRFGRLSLRRSTNGALDSPGGTGGTLLTAPQFDTPTRGGRNQPVKRTKSCPDFPQARQGARTNRRVAANNTPDSSQQLQQQQQFPLLCEEEDGAITYTANLLGSRPRIMDVCIPKVTPEGVAGAEWKQYLESCDDTDDCRMLGCFKQLQQRLESLENSEEGQDTESESGENGNDSSENFGLLALQNRPPWWNIELGSFVLNFGGRVSVASVKNFQLCDRNDQDRIMLQFGRIQGRHSFTMDFQHPLTAVQAFSIAISSLQSKISFG